MPDLGQGKDFIETKAVCFETLNTLNGIVRTNASGDLSSSVSVDVDELTLSNIETDNFKADVVDTDGTLAADSDTRIPSQKAVKAYIGGMVDGLSWRPAVDLHDSTETDAGANIVGQASYLADSVALVNGDRLLLTAETTAAATYNDKVFLASGVGSAIVLTLETDGQAGTGAPTDGDVMFIQKGTVNGDKNLVYNGTDWTLAASMNGALVATNNLSDLANAATARANLVLGNVDNTADSAKPVSTATQTALDLKAAEADVLKKDGSVALTAQMTESYSGVLSIVAANGVTDVTKKYIKIQSSTAGACDVTANPQIAAGVEGREYVFIGQDDTKTVTFDDGTGLALNGAQSFTLGAKDTLVLYFDGTDYVELSRSDN